MQNYFAIWTTAANGGLFYHYDGFRYHPDVGFGLDFDLQQLVGRIINITLSSEEVTLVRGVSRNTPGNGQPMMSPRENYDHGFHGHKVE